MVGSRGQSWCLARGIVARLGLGGRDVPDRLEEALVVEPVHPLEGGVFDGFKAPPRATAADDLRFGLASKKWRVPDEARGTP